MQDESGHTANVDFSHITQGSDGNLYVTDYCNHVIRRVPPDSEVTLFAGTLFQ